MTPYLLPAYVSKRVEGSAWAGHRDLDHRRGRGRSLSRTGSGIAAEYGGWRTVYGVATGLMALTLVILAWRLEGKTSTGNIVPGETRYGTMMRALGRLAFARPRYCFPAPFGA